MRILILFLLVSILHSGDSAPDPKVVGAFVNNQQQQQVRPNELLKKIKEQKKKVEPRKRSVFNELTYDKPAPKPRKRASSLHRDFIIYKFEQIDEDLRILRDDYLYAEEALTDIRSREKIYLEALEELIVRNRRYDHFFTKWDDLKKSTGGLWTAGGASIVTAIFGFLGILFQRRRKKKKEMEKNHV